MNIQSNPMSSNIRVFIKIYFSRFITYSIKLYIGITISMYSALPIWVLFILLTQLVNGAQFLNITFLLVLFAATAASVVLLTVIYPITSIYASL